MTTEYLKRLIAEKGHRGAINSLAEFGCFTLADYIRKRDIERELNIFIKEYT